MLTATPRERSEWARKAYGIYREIRRREHGHVYPAWEDLQAEEREVYTAFAIAAVEAAEDSEKV